MENKEIKITFHQRSHLLARWEKAKAQAEAAQAAGKRKVENGPPTVATPHDKKMMAPQESFGNPSDPCTFKG